MKSSCANTTTGIRIFFFFLSHFNVECEKKNEEKRLTEDVAKDLPAPHAHAKEDLVLHDQDSDTEEGADEGGIAAPVVKEGLKESDDCMDVT